MITIQRLFILFGILSLGFNGLSQNNPYPCMDIFPSLTPFIVASGPDEILKNPSIVCDTSDVAFLHLVKGKAFLAKDLHLEAIYEFTQSINYLAIHADVYFKENRDLYNFIIMKSYLFRAHLNILQKEYLSAIGDLTFSIEFIDALEEENVKEHMWGLYGGFISINQAMLAYEYYNDNERAKEILLFAAKQGCPYASYLLGFYKL